MKRPHNRLQVDRALTASLEARITPFSEVDLSIGKTACMMLTCCSAQDLTIDINWSVLLAISLRRILEMFDQEVAA